MTQSQPEITQEQLEAIAFVGNTLGPLFYHDPASGTTDALFEALGLEVLAYLVQVVAPLEHIVLYVE